MREGRDTRGHLVDKDAERQALGMSVRFAFESHARCTPTPAIGGIYGAAIGLPVGGPWAPMAVSPPRSPPLLASTPALSMENLDLNDDAQKVVVRAACDDDESPVLEQICPLWVHNLAIQAPALLLFDQAADTTETTLLQSHPRRLRVHGVVTPKTVTARSLTWRPLVDMGEVVGVVFLLGSGRDEVCEDDAKPAARARGRGADAVARIEVSAAPPGAALGSVAVVQSSYSPLAMASGMADPSSYLLYPNPEAHLASMREVRVQLQQGEDVGYVPARELCVTSAFDRLVLRSNPAETGAQNDAARRAWLDTKQFLKALSTLTADSVTAYNAAEIDRVGAFELRHTHGSWRGSVV